MPRRSDSAPGEWLRPIAQSVDELINRFGIEEFRRRVMQWLTGRLGMRRYEPSATLPMPLPVPKQSDPELLEKFVALSVIRDEFCKGERIIDEANVAGGQQERMEYALLTMPYFAMRSCLRDPNYVRSEYHDDEDEGHDPEGDPLKLRQWIGHVEEALLPEQPDETLESVLRDKEEHERRLNVLGFRRGNHEFDRWQTPTYPESATEPAVVEWLDDLLQGLRQHDTADVAQDLAAQLSDGKSSYAPAGYVHDAWAVIRRLFALEAIAELPAEPNLLNRPSWTDVLLELRRLRKFLAAAPPLSAGGAPSVREEGGKRRSTARGEADKKLAAAFVKHHKYEPIGNRSRPTSSHGSRVFWLKTPNPARPPRRDFSTSGSAATTRRTGTAATEQFAPTRTGITFSSRPANRWRATWRLLVC